MLEPTSQGAVVLAAVALVLLTVATMAMWNRVRAPFRWPARVVMVISCELVAVAVASLAINSEYDFYTSWREVLGQSPKITASPVSGGLLDQRLDVELARAAAHGRGFVIPMRIPGVRSRIRSLPALVYLPPQYSEAEYAHRDFPVVELLPGYPGGPQTWTGVLHIADTLDADIDSGRITPMIAVMPTEHVASPRDTECANVVRGPQAATYLTSDVRAAVDRDFRAVSSQSGWTVMGFSTGGYCSSILASQYPGMYAAAASLEGYNAAAHDHTTGSLFGGSVALADENNLLWRVQHHQAPTVPLLFVSTKQDRLAYRDDRRLDAAVTPGMRVWQLVLPRGGHNKTTFSAEIPTALSWLSRYVQAPLAPADVVDGLAPRQVRPHPAPPPAATSRPLLSERK